MISKSFNVMKKIMPIVSSLAMGIAFSAQAQGIKALTSQESAEKAQGGEVARPIRGGTPLNKHYIGIGVGQTFLKSEFEKNGADKIGIPDLYYVYTASHSFDFMANIHSTTHRFEGRKVTASGAAFGIKGRFYQYDNFAPFGVAGLGFYQPTVVRNINGSFIRSDSKITFGTNLGVGAELILNSRVTIGTIWHWHNPFSIQQEGQPDVRGSYYKLLLTGLYSF